jgi:hypothetical protein
VEVSTLGSNNWLELTEEIDFMFGRLKKHKQVIFEVNSTSYWNCNAKIRVKGSRGINPTDPALLPASIQLLLSQCIQGYYNFQEAKGLVISEEKSQNLTTKWENDSTKGGNALNTLESINPSQITALKSLFESYKVNYNYPL